MSSQHSMLESYIVVMEAIRDDKKFPEWLPHSDVGHILDSLVEQGSITRRPLTLTEKGVQVIRYFHRASELVEKGG